ncbi:GrdB-related putative oxidoreductase [Lactococcus garvieae]|jgi:glycine/betaine/sarcosine/D-proline reductase family selenoprotein B|uniref:GrdB-related putative oxidoreductase n=1 Tax=Lactococcus garvieae TaxID=1363 RepID=UPI0009C01AFE|nr:GrdB-related putative oxidoreductase [Lactococcus garvieae]
MRLVMILNQIQAGVGTKDDVKFPLTATKEVIGPGVTLKPLLTDSEQNLLVTIYMGEQTYTDSPDIIRRKIKGMLERLNIEGVICGPSFNYPAFSKMSLELAQYIQEEMKLKVICAMSEENESLISAYKEEIDIVKMPKKGGVGLNESYKTICKVLKAKENNKGRETYKQLIY